MMGWVVVALPPFARYIVLHSTPRPPRPSSPLVVLGARFRRAARRLASRRPTAWPTRRPRGIGSRTASYLKNRPIGRPGQISFAGSAVAPVADDRALTAWHGVIRAIRQESPAGAEE